VSIVGGDALDVAMGGVVTMVVASVRRCIVLTYTTSSAGAGAEQHVGDRLATIADGVVGSIRLKRSLSPEREPLQLGPR
jgi:hypothetical protein